MSTRCGFVSRSRILSDRQVDPKSQRIIYLDFWGMNAREEGGAGPEEHASTLSHVMRVNAERSTLL